MTVEQPREQFEYLFADYSIIQGSSTGNIIYLKKMKSFLEEKGKEGWELVSFNCEINSDYFCHPLLIFKRKKQNDTEKI